MFTEIIKQCLYMFGADNCHWLYGSRTVDMKNYVNLNYYMDPCHLNKEKGT